MKTVRLTLDAELLAEVDAAVQTLGTNRSAFLCDALRDALRQLSIREREEIHAAGYARRPVRAGEFDGWDAEQVWPDP